ESIARARAPPSKHSPPLTLRKDLSFPEGFDLSLPGNARRRKFVPLRCVISSEENVPQRESEGEIPVLMLGQAAVVDAVHLGTAEKNARLPHLKTHIHVADPQERAEHGGEAPCQQPQLRGIAFVELKQECHGREDQQGRNEHLDPVLTVE